MVTLYLLKRNSSSVRLFSMPQCTSHFLQGTRKTRPCLSRQVVRRHFSKILLLRYTLFQFSGEYRRCPRRVYSECWREFWPRRLRVLAIITHVPVSLAPPAPLHTPLTGSGLSDQIYRMPVGSAWIYTLKNTCKFPQSYRRGGGLRSPFYIFIIIIYNNFVGKI